MNLNITTTTLLLSLFFFSCDDDSNVVVEPNQPGDGTEFTCDPVGANPDLGEIVNTPLEEGVEVIVKTPTHPGNPGPENLP